MEKKREGGHGKDVIEGSVTADFHEGPELAGRYSLGWVGVVGRISAAAEPLSQICSSKGPGADPRILSPEIFQTLGARTNLLNVFMEPIGIVSPKMAATGKNPGL